MIRMVDQSGGDEGASILQRIRSQPATLQVRITQHASQEMVAEGVALSAVLEAIASAELLENYPEHRRGPCCLLPGRTVAGRDLHVVCTTATAVLVIITVCEPTPPKWVTPRKRGT